ncbi:MAG: NAD(P)/FAD-dependent oxidoreductase [Bacteroidota bacterium]
MNDRTSFEVIIIGGSYAGLSAAMTLGRSLRRTLIIDSGTPCNQPTPHAHNFITHDGAEPQVIAQKAKAQVLKYERVQFKSGKAIRVLRQQTHFRVILEDDSSYQAKKLLLATGLRDLMLPIEGFAACWGKSVLHCPYCHGYEVKSQKTGILANGTMAYEMSQLLLNWTKDLILFTNGPAQLDETQRAFLKRFNIDIIEQEITALIHEKGEVQKVVGQNGIVLSTIDAIYARTPFEQQCSIPVDLGCQLSEQGHIEVDFFQKTSVEGVFAAGDNTTPFRTLSLATASGTKAGVAINKELIEASYLV